MPSSTKLRGVQSPAKHITAHSSQASARIGWWPQRSAQAVGNWPDPMHLMGA